MIMKGKEAFKSVLGENKKEIESDLLEKKWNKRFARRSLS